MSDKQELFCIEYMVDLNATQAAIRAGYSPKTAAQQGERLLRNVEVRARIQREKAERSRRTGVNADRVVRELARIAFVQVADVVNMSDATVRGDAGKDDLAAIASVKVKKTAGDGWDAEEREVRLADKLKALELLGRHCGMWNDKDGPQVPITVVVNYDYGENADGGKQPGVQPDIPAGK